jgi:thioredoxin reductase
MAQLLKMDGVEMDTSSGGFVPKCDESGATSIPGIYAAGDVAESKRHLRR